jgi:hypothetical protein
MLLTPNVLHLDLHQQQLKKALTLLSDAIATSMRDLDRD